MSKIYQRIARIGLALAAVLILLCLADWHHGFGASYLAVPLVLPALIVGDRTSRILSLALIVLAVRLGILGGEVHNSSGDFIEPKQVIHFLRTKPPGTAKDIPGFAPAARKTKQIQFENSEIRGTVIEHYRGLGQDAFVLLVENLGSAPLKLTPAGIPLKGILALEFERIELAPRSSTAREASETDSSHAFLVIENKGAGSHAP